LIDRHRKRRLGEPGEPRNVKLSIKKQKKKPIKRKVLHSLVRLVRQISKHVKTLVRLTQYHFFHFLPFFSKKVLKSLFF
jgi:hypothetical protein